ncbi:hypothetical protein ACQKWADRAFT_300087 [Trichoderma austrokoningii]
MEQPDTSSPSSPLQPRRRNSVLPRLSRPSASHPAPPLITSPSATSTLSTAGTSLASSEPTLRFPRPQGNKQLANWISSSNPNMMDLAPLHEDNSLLSESTYELISGPSTDTEESQDDNYTGSMSESVGSLDIHRPDDVQSLAGTEDSYETESAVDEADMPSTAASDRDDTEDEEDDEDSVHEDSVLAESHFTNETAKLEPFPLFENEAYAHSSLEYTQQSLGTPSFPTPEASRLIERPVSAEPEKKKSWKQKMAEYWPFDSETREYLAEATWGGFPGFAFIFIVLVALPIFIRSPSESALSNVQAPPPITATVTTTTYLTTTSSLATPSSQPTPSSTNSVALVPIGEPQSDDWIFGAKKPAISFTAEAHNDILIHIPKSIKKTWMAKDCLSVSAKRGDDIVDTTMSMEDEGIRLKFAKKEVHGVVSLVLEAQCRPKVHKVVKVHFGKGLMEEAFERTKHLAHDLSGLMPAAAQEAERCIENAKQSINSACQNVCQTVTETVSKTFGATFADAKQNLDNLVSTAKAQFEEATQEFTTRFDSFAQQAVENLPSAEDVQNQLQLQLLDAQISAKLWWLQTFGSAEEHDEYLRKAKSYSAKKHAAAEEMKHAKKEVPEKPMEVASRFWSKLMSR